MMAGDMGEVFNAWKDRRRTLRATFGVDCPKCAEARPRASPSILLPQQRCKMDGYRDPRPRLTDEQEEQTTGWRKVQDAR